jgi:pyridoxamine 5'-phosphate oxidase
MVYLKELESGTATTAGGGAGAGFVVYSNFGTSRKSADLATNPHASLCFWWKPLERQVRVEGKVQRLTPEESQVYFDTRARGSRIGAWASQQSTVLQPQTETGEGDDGRLDLETRVKRVEERFADQQQIPVPPFWGGLRIVPDSVEFWQGRESRLHDRFLYTRTTADAEGRGAWKIERLSP